MAGAYVAGGLIGNGQSSQTNTVSATIPAGAAVGHVALVSLTTDVSTGTFTPPTGWTWSSGPNRRSSSPSTTTQWYAKVLAGGDIGSTVVFQYSESRRIVGTISVFSGVTTPDAAAVAFRSESTSTTATLPLVPGVPAGTMMVAVYGRDAPSGRPQFTGPPSGYAAGVQSRTNHATANVVSYTAYRTAPAAGTYGGETATTDIATGGISALILLPPVAAGGAAEVFGATATATLSASGGSAGAPVSASVTGVTALVVAEGGNAPVAPPLPLPGTWPPAPYREAIRSQVAIWYTVDALLDGSPVAGATSLAPTGGTITDTIKPGVRRLLNLELAPTPGLFDLLAPIGTELKVTAHVRYTSREVLDIPMGVFVVDSEKLSEGGGGISLTAPDRWCLIQRARFIQPLSSAPGLLATDQIARLIGGAMGVVTVNNYASSKTKMGPLTWEKDRDKAILDVAKSIGAWVFFDRNGAPTIADLPTAKASADWLVDASSSGVMTSLDRERSRANTYNVVVVESSATDGPAFPTQIVWDDDPASPTYAGTNPLTNPGSAGPFGIVPYYYATPLPLDVGAARHTGKTILARVSGLASQVSAGQVPNPALDAFAALDVMPPRERYDQPRVLERHVVDTVTHPLTVGPDQQIEGRSTRTEEIDGGS